ncbi:MAG: RagB/SusD family nutrient uptake outer membrane protein, partial [Bacteroidales bacterium]|nr:RagB/SusD family nutrient uptake outer membrane protein [Bacteroidales bacterium]
MKTIKYVFLLVVLFNLHSCTDELLDKQPLDRYTDAVVWDDPALIDAFLLSQYAYTPVMINDATTMFSSWEGSPLNKDPRTSNLRYWFGNSAQTFGPGLSIEISDEAKYTSGAWANLVPEKAWGISPDGGMMEWWENAYYTIRNLNEFIHRVPDSPLANSKKEIRVAEARFLRAYCYFAMVKRYGGVPLLTQVPELDSPDSLLYPPRKTEQQLWDFVLTETREIASVLPSVQEEYGRATKWAALSLHNRAALYAGSIARYGELSANRLTGLPGELADGYFKMAYDAANEIITQGPFDLYQADIKGNDLPSRVQNFKNVFLVKRNVETIMAKQHGGQSFDPGGGTTTWSWDICQAPRPSVWGQGNYQAPYLELVEAFEYIDGRPGTLDRDYVQS